MANKPQQYTAGVPEDVKKLREQLIQMIMSGMQRGATPYAGPIAPQINPLSLGAANMLNNMMGYGQYQHPGYIMNPYANQGGMGQSVAGRVSSATPALLTLLSHIINK